MIKDDIARIFRKYYDTDMTIQHTGIESINEALDNVATSIINKALTATSSSIITSHDITNATNAIMPTSLGNKISQDIYKTFSELERGNPTGGLTVSTDRIHADLLSLNITLSPSASFALSAILEHLAIRILDLAIAATDDLDILDANIRIALSFDSAIHALTKKKRATSGGIFPSVHRVCIVVRT